MSETTTDYPSSLGIGDFSARQETMREPIMKDLRLGKKSRKQSKSTNHIGEYFQKQFNYYHFCPPDFVV